MATKRTYKTPVAPSLTPEQAEEMSNFLDAVVHRFKGNFEELESAVGMYVLARHIGWKPLFVIHSKKTIRKYEQILGTEDEPFSFRDRFEAEGPEAMRSVGYKIAKTFSNFWKVVSGEEKVDRTGWRELI
jgi:hypothetical protein